MLNILKQTGITLITHGKEWNPVSLTTLTSNVPMVLSLDNGDTITNPYDIANTFHNYITSIAKTTKKENMYMFFRLSFNWKWW